MFQAHEFFFFASAIIAIAILFAIMSYFYKYIDPVKLIADQSGQGYSPPHYDDEDSDAISAENKTLLPSKSPNEYPLSDTERDSPSFDKSTIKPSDESGF